MHLDPDFEYVTYGDQGERARQLREHLQRGDLIVFYAAFQDIRDRRPLVYALIGLLVVEDLIPAGEVPIGQRDRNAHTRRILSAGVNDVIVRGRPGCSGRLRGFLQIGEYRDRAYRVRRDVLDAWGDVSVKGGGYLQRSARLPRFCSDPRFRGCSISRQRATLEMKVATPSPAQEAPRSIRSTLIFRHSMVTFEGAADC